MLININNFHPYGSHETLGRLCHHCNGDGRVFGHTTINPSEKERWLECSECGGSGEIEVSVEEEDDEE